MLFLSDTLIWQRKKICVHTKVCIHICTIFSICKHLCWTKLKHYLILILPNLVNYHMVNSILFPLFICFYSPTVRNMASTIHCSFVDCSIPVYMYSCHRIINSSPCTSWKTTFPRRLHCSAPFALNLTDWPHFQKYLGQ